MEMESNAALAAEKKERKDAKKDKKKKKSKKRKRPEDGGEDKAVAKWKDKASETWVHQL